MQKQKISVIHLVGNDTTVVQAGALRVLRANAVPTVARVLYVGEASAPPSVPKIDEQIRPRFGGRLPASRGLGDIVHPGDATVLHVWSRRVLDWLAAGVQSLSRRSPDRIPPIVLELDPPGDLHRWNDSFRLLNALTPMKIVSSDETVWRRLAEFDVRPEQCLSVETGVEHERFANPERAALRASLELSPHEFAVLPLPPVTRDSGAFVAAWSAMLLEHARPGVRLLIPEAGPETKRIVNLVRACKLDRLLAEQTSDTDWTSLLSAADAAVFLPERAAPTAGVHWAMASGCPLVVSDVPALRSLLVPGQTAWFCPPNDPKAACRTLLTVVENPEQSRRQAVAAQEQARRAFGLRRMLSQYRSLYETLLGEHRFAGFFKVPLID